MGEQKQHLDQTVAKATAQGAKEAAEPAGENDLAPTVKAEKIKAEIPATGAAAAAGGAGPGADDETASIVADQEYGPAAEGRRSPRRPARSTPRSRSTPRKAAQDKAAAARAGRRRRGQGQGRPDRRARRREGGRLTGPQDWTSEQKQQADAAKHEATGHVGEAHTAIQGEKTRGRRRGGQARRGRRQGSRGRQAQGRRRSQTREGEGQGGSAAGGGFFGWVASKAKALYDKVKDGITAIFNKVRSAITSAINKAKELAHSVIDRAVKFVADKVKAVAGKLLAIGDRLIPGFAAAPARSSATGSRTASSRRSRPSTRSSPRSRTASARSCHAVGNALKAGLDLLKKGINAAINAVKNVVKAAIEKAKAADRRARPVRGRSSRTSPPTRASGLSNLGAAIIDGIKNHLWKALKTAIRPWFNEKLESMLGLGKCVWNLLTKGGITIAQVGKMAFEAIKAAIPPALIAILVERLVSMIVPAAGAVMAIDPGPDGRLGRDPEASSPRSTASSPS